MGLGRENKTLAFWFDAQLVVCGRLLVFCGRLLVVCSCLLVVCDRLCSFVVVACFSNYVFVSGIFISYSSVTKKFLYY